MTMIGRIVLVLLLALLAIGVAAESLQMWNARLAGETGSDDQHLDRAARLLAAGIGVVLLTGLVLTVRLVRGHDRLAPFLARLFVIGATSAGLLGGFAASKVLDQHGQRYGARLRLRLREHPRRR